MPEILSRSVKISGEYFTIAGLTHLVFELDGSANIAWAQGTTVPVAGTAGFAIGCTYTKTNGTPSNIVWTNEGTASSCNFTAQVTGTNMLLTAITSLSSAQILALNATPVTLVAAPGAGNQIVIDNIEFKMVTTATAYSGGGNVTFQYSGGNAVTNNIAAAVVTAGAGTSYTIRQGIDVTAANNTAVTVTNASGAFSTGTGTAVVTTKYRIITP